MTNSDIMKIGVNQNAYPQFLFKYRSVNSNTQRIITANELWFSNPLEFNDPYDCNTPINSKRQLNLSPGLAKIAPYLPCHRDNFPAKVPGEVAGWLPQVTLTAHTRWPLAISIKNSR